MKRAESVRVAYPLFQAEGGGSTPTSALQLRFDQCSVEFARDMNRRWHSVLPRTVYGNIVRNRRRICHQATANEVCMAVAIWTDPVAANRLTDGDRLLELRRMAIASDAPKNTASRMLAWMRRDVKKRWPELAGLVSYQDTIAHKGTIYAAAGWKVEQENGTLTDWNANGRERQENQSAAPKTRWGWRF